MENALLQLEPGFAVELDVFSGPFSVLLSLIAQQRLDVTTVSLSEVTDAFIAFIKEQQGFDLSEISEFLVVAATLLDLKLARLLPHEESDVEDIELLERRDILFAKLLQYRAFKEVAEAFREISEAESRTFARNVPLEQMYAEILPEVNLALGPEELAMLAVQAMTREASEPEVLLTHLHNPTIPVAGQIDYIRTALHSAGSATFETICQGAPNLATVVSRFMAVLELLRGGEVVIEQDEPLGAILLTLTSSASAQANASTQASASAHASASAQASASASASAHKGESHVG